MIPLTALATPVEQLGETFSGECGPNAVWSLDTETGELIVSGSGAMTKEIGYYQSYIKTAVISSGITSICNNAFSNCASLTRVVIGNDVLEIGKKAFYSCTSLNSVQFGKSVRSIGSQCFEYCSSLETINFPDSLVRIGYEAFADTLWYSGQPDGIVYAGKVAYTFKGTMFSPSLTIRDGTKAIADGGFSSIPPLESVTIPDSVEIIGGYAFYNCPLLKNVLIGKGVIASFFYAYAKYKGYSLKGAGSLNGFTDASQISSWANMRY